MPTTTVCSCGFEGSAGGTITFRTPHSRMRDVHVHDGIAMIPAPSLLVHCLRQLADWFLRHTEHPIVRGVRQEARI